MAAAEDAAKSHEPGRLPEPSGPRLDPDEAAKPVPFIDKELWHDWPLRLLVIAVCAAVFLPMLGAFGLWDPWEVHYGEVGRQMVERSDWLSPWWGSHWQSPGQPVEGEYFFSKPVMLLWLMGGGMTLFGHTAFAVRIGTMLIALLGVYSAYLAGRRIWSPRAGLLMAMTLGTSPFYFMLSRQAQTDMPYVGLMTAALCFFMMGVFGEDRNRRADRLSFWLLLGIVGVFSAWQLHVVVIGLSTFNTELHPVDAFFRYGPVQGVLYVGLLAAVFFSLLRSAHPTRGQYRLMWFYVLVALATMAKGLLGFALPGAIIFLYLLVSRDWGMLRRAEIPRGVGMAIAVGLPWYGAMISKHGGIGGEFWTRFIIHDHFKRLASGVHQTDTGSFEHFIRWLGYGLFPWGAFIPGMFATALRRDQQDEVSDRRRARLFIFLWFFMAFTLFTASSTKFHHYIFPAVPALALLAGLWLNDLLSGRIAPNLRIPLVAAALALAAIIGADLIADPQNLKNMFTYRYDRDWPSAAWDPEFRRALIAIVATAGLGFITLLLSRRAWSVRAGVLALSLSAFAFAYWTLDVYMPTVAHSWSQQGVWDAYYSRCTPAEAPPGAHPMKVYCEEPVVSFKLNWRGETFHTQNEVIPIRSDEDWEYFVENNGESCFYAIMDGGRFGTFRNELPSNARSSLEQIPTDDTMSWLSELDADLLHDFLEVRALSNIKFVLARVNCDDEEAEREEGEAQEEDSAGDEGGESQP